MTKGFDKVDFVKVWGQYLSPQAEQYNPFYQEQKKIKKAYSDVANVAYFLGLLIKGVSPKDNIPFSNE